MRLWSRALVFLLLLVNARAAAPAKERWLYIPTNFQVDERTDAVIALLERAAKAGYTHALVTDSKFCRLETVTAGYRPNVGRVKAAAAKLHIELVPAVFPVGYSNDLLFHDPNLAEGLPVKDAPFVVKDGVATIRPDPALTLPGGAMNDRKGWDFLDDSLEAIDGAMRSGPTEGNARMFRKIKVEPFRQYHASVRIRTEGFGGGEPEIKAAGKSDRQLQYTRLKVAADGPWTTFDVTFNSLDATEVGLYFGIWGGHRGTLWWDDAAIEECGPVNLLRRPGAPLVVKKADGTVLKEERDFEPLADPGLGTTPWPGAYTAWHLPPAIRVKGVAEGEVLKVSYFHTHIVYDEQVAACVEEPAFQRLLRQQARDVAGLWGARSHLMSHDEWRLLGWDESCRAAGLSPGGIAARNARFCTGVLKEYVPGGRILVWNDMFDPHHNAVKNYYLVNGSLEGSWEGLESGVEIMNWNFDHRDESLAFFAGRGHAQVIAGFYDGSLDQVSAWLASAAKVKGVKGFMYTTWRNDYSKLEEVAAILEKAGW